jgi:hypothetical protein
VAYFPLLLVVLLLVGCNGQPAVSTPQPMPTQNSVQVVAPTVEPALNTFRPEYVKTLTVTKEGNQGFQVSFILSGRDGLTTAPPGRAVLEVFEGTAIFGQEPIVSVQADLSSYSYTQSPEGPRYSFGRIDYSSGRRDRTETQGIVQLTFTSQDGSMVSSQQEVPLDR